MLRQTFAHIRDISLSLDHEAMSMSYYLYHTYYVILSHSMSYYVMLWHTMSVSSDIQFTFDIYDIAGLQATTGWKLRLKHQTWQSKAGRPGSVGR